MRSRVAVPGQLEHAAPGGEHARVAVADDEPGLGRRVVVLEQLEEEAEPALAALHGLRREALVAVEVDRAALAVRADEERHRGSVGTRAVCAGLRSAAEPDRVQVVRGDLVGARGSGPRCRRARRGGSGRRARPRGPRRARGRAAARAPAASTARRRRSASVMSVRTSPGLMTKTGMPSGGAARASVSPKRPSAALLAPYAVSVLAFVRAGTRPPLPMLHDPPAAALDHAAGSTAAAAEIGAEHVDLEARATTPRARPPRTASAARRCPALFDEQVDRPELVLRALDPRLDVLAARDVADEREPADLGGDGLDLLRVRPLTATRIPASASSRAIEAPIPRPPPVTSATPSSRSDGTRDLLQRLGVLERREVARILRRAPVARTARRTIFALRVFGSAGDEERPARA